ncbi:MAG: hypothetical protein U0441_38195 [Polyangiaceae bacterium]
MDSEVDVAREVEAAVQKALENAGVQGRVKIEGRNLTLHGGGAAVEIDALYLVEQWALLPPDLRERKASDVATRLIDANAAAGSGTLASAGLGVSGRPTSGAPAGGGPSLRPGASQRPPQRSNEAPPNVSGAPRPYVPSVRPLGAPAPGARRPPFVIPLGALVVLGGIVALVMLYRSGQSPSPTNSSGSATTATATGAATESADARNSRLCEAARARVLSSGTLAQIDAEVWLAELWLASSKTSDLAHAKGLDDLVQQGKLTASADPDLAAVQLGSVEIAGDEGRPDAGYHAIQIRFRGGYVSQFFDAAGREKMNRVAGKLADATGAELGALYGRCAHLRYHDIGAWFRGATVTHAATSLVYTMGFFSERRLTNHDPNAPPKTADLGPLFTALGKMERASLESAVRDAGGTFAPGASAADPTTITFPMGGPTRAARATGDVAKSAGMGPDAPRTGTGP